MEEYKLGIMERKFADIIWENAPISSGELVKICCEKLGWKKSTTYTMLRRLCQRGIFENSDGKVKTITDKESFISMQSKQFVDETFSGSLPGFIAAFTRKNKLSESDIKELRSIIDNYEKGD